VQLYTHPVTVDAMPRIDSHCASYDATARNGRASRAAVVMIVGAMLLQACNGSDATEPASPSGTSAGQQIATATVGSALPSPIKLTVTGSDGRLAKGVRVVWLAGEGGKVSSAETLTDGNGVTSTRWTLGTIAGPQTLTAYVSGLAPVVFSALGTADRAVAVRFSNSHQGAKGTGARATVLGDTVVLNPSAVDRFGNSVTTDPTLVLESGVDVVSVVNGALVARARGTAVLRAMIDTAVARLTVVVEPATPSIARLAPDTIVPGATIRIDGENFTYGVDGLDVTVAGVKATVLSATPTQIDAILPIGALPCQAAGMHTVKVSIAANSSQRSAPLRVAKRISLARGESANMLAADDVRCTELVAPSAASSSASTRAKYVVAVINTSVTAAATSGFELRGAGTGALAGQIAVSRAPLAAQPAASALPLPSMGSSATALPLTTVPERLAEGRHDDFLEAQRTLARAAGQPSIAWRARAALRSSSGSARGSSPGSARGLSTARAPVAVGDTLTMKALYSSCSTGRDIRARVVYSGTRSLVLEDVLSPRAGQLDAQYRQIGDEFDRVQYPLLQSRIGDPLAMNSAMDGDGRVTMLFTRFVNDSLPGIAGYVTACNFYAKSIFAGSNEDEIFYARVPSAVESPTDWRRTMRSTVMHEAKHLAAFAERFAQDVPLEEAWLEESTARIAEELYSRTFSNGGLWKGNVGFSTTVRCEVYQCDDRPLMMWKHFSVLQQYLRGVDTLTPIGAAASGDFTYYASGWSLVRWAADQYATDESAWLKALVRGGALTGLANLAQRTGRPAVEMLADWALANAVDDLAGFTPKRAQLTFPSWNVADVMGGLAGTYPMSFLAAPLKARAMSFGAFALPVTRLRAFSSSYFSFDGEQLGSQLLELRGENGAAVPPTSLRVAIVRVE